LKENLDLQKEQQQKKIKPNINGLELRKNKTITSVIVGAVRRGWFWK